MKHSSLIWNSSLLLEAENSIKYEVSVLRFIYSKAEIALS